MTGQQVDVLVIGSGVIGLACAHALVQQGRRVRVVDRGDLGAGASWGNCGIISVSHAIPLCAPGVIGQALRMMVQRDAPLALRPGWSLDGLTWLLRFAGKCSWNHAQRAMRSRADLLAYSRALFDRLLAEHPMDCEWEARGALFLCRTPRVLDEFARIEDQLVQIGLQGQALSGGELQSREPGLRQDLAGGWAHSIHAHLRPDRFVQEWARVVTEQGVEVLTQCEVLGFEVRGGRIASIQTSRGPMQARDVILAAGAWSAKLGGKLGLALPVRPARGISLTVAPQESCCRTPCFLVDERTVATPFKSGFRLGGRLELCGFDTRVKPRHLQLLKGAFQKYFRSDLSSGPEEGWAGLRPMTFDDLPVLGRSRQAENLYLATGHNMLGLSMAPATGQILADLIAGQTPAIDIAAFDPNRFA